MTASTTGSGARIIEQIHWIKAVVAVADGRGFVIEACGQRLVVTAFHCLPHPPACLYVTPPLGRVYTALLGLPGAEPTVPAECLFADPVADLAVLGAPVPQQLPGEFAAYRALVDAAQPISIGALKRSDGGQRRQACEASLLSLDGRWIACRLTRGDRGLWFSNASEAIRGGSGGPIIAADGAAVGVLCTASSESCFTSGGPNPELITHLPGWILHGAPEPERKQCAIRCA